MMSYSLQVAGRSRVVVGRTVEELPRLLPQGRVVVLTDRNVARCRPELFEGCDPICMEPGEEHKTLQTVEAVCRELIRRGADRTTFLLGVGGGIVTDVTGFVASVYMRGVPFGFVSTTLLGCVDASVGGKNGVNLDGYKNMAGVFAQPQFVVCDTSLFATLPLREIRAGLAEAVKAGIIGDESLFGLIERAGLDGLCADPEVMDKVVVHSVRLKAAVVSRDEREHGERRKLNLGHTFGHAVEKCSREMIHGEAVAVGMAIAARLAVKLGLLAPAACDRIVRLLAALGFVTEPPVPAERLLAAVTKDKKSEGRVIASVGGDRPMPAMSTFKFPLALAAAARLDSLGLPLSAQLEVTGDDLWPDTWSPLREEHPAGGRFSFGELLHYTVAESDNCACDRLIREIGGVVIRGGVLLITRFLVGAAFGIGVGKL